MKIVSNEKKKPGTDNNACNPATGILRRVHYDKYVTISNPAEKVNQIIIGNKSSQTTNLANYRLKFL